MWGGGGVAEEEQEREQQAKGTCLTRHRLSMALMLTGTKQIHNGLALNVVGSIYNSPDV